MYQDRTPQTSEELHQQLVEQLQLLSNSAEAYDRGEHFEAKRIATTLRILLYDQGQSHSLLGQLNLLKNKFYDTASQSEMLLASGQFLGGYAGLISLQIGENGQYIPYLDDAPPFTTEFVNFETYWNRTIFIAINGDRFSRKDIVCAVANQDGGAHIDGAIDTTYHDFSRNNGMGWQVSGNGSVPSNPNRSDLPALRQMAHEVLKSLTPEYPRRKFPNTMTLIGPAIFMTVNSALILEEVNRWNNIEPYDNCPCKSDKKYKWCCGRKFEQINT
jgi:hypothetical protein